jgi:hypothetical protein
MPLFFLFNIQTMHIKSLYTQRALLCFPKPNTLAGFEPGLLVSKADAMSTSPRRQGLSLKLIIGLAPGFSATELHEGIYRQCHKQYYYLNLLPESLLELFPFRHEMLSIFLSTKVDYILPGIFIKQSLSTDPLDQFTNPVSRPLLRN